MSHFVAMFTSVVTKINPPVRYSQNIVVQLLTLAKRFTDYLIIINVQDVFKGKREISNYMQTHCLQ